MNMNKPTSEKSLASRVYPGNAEALLMFLDPCDVDNESVTKEALALAEIAGLPTEMADENDDSESMFNELRAIVYEVYGKRNAENDPR